jgi:hypothetical protein
MTFYALQVNESMSLRPVSLTEIRPISGQTEHFLTGNHRPSALPASLRKTRRGGIHERAHSAGHGRAFWSAINAVRAKYCNRRR